MANYDSDKPTNILIVSGHSGIRQRLEQDLRTQGYQVVGVSDGEAALNALKRFAPDIVLTSGEMYGMSGIQLSRALSRIYPHVPIIIAYNRPQPDQVAQALASGAADVISESATVEDVDILVQRCLQRTAAASQRIMTDRLDVFAKTLRALTAAIDAKSRYAARHSSRVTQLCQLIGARMNLTSKQMAILELAAQLHDVGKIGTPDTVLSKPDTLTDEEWVDVLKHPAMGGAILAGVPELAEIASIIRHHHEHFDGRGYPDGLQGNAIPLFARIIAVADAYEAMTSDRPYRQSMTHEKAVEELKKNSGTQFDPEIVDYLVDELNNTDVRRRAA